MWQIFPFISGIIIIVILSMIEAQLPNEDDLAQQLSTAYAKMEICGENNQCRQVQQNSVDMLNNALELRQKQSMPFFVGKIAGGTISVISFLVIFLGRNN